MKRIHLNLTVADIDKSVAFYSRLFAEEPTVRHSDYAKWMLDDPRVNFAISTHGANAGIDHVGIQVENDSEMAEIRDRLNAAEAEVYDQGDVTCCYAESTKAWVRDPDGVAWETFQTHGQVTTYGDGGRESGQRTHSGEDTGCCGAPATGEGGKQDACC